jgi:hypothetical protein
MKVKPGASGICMSSQATWEAEIRRPAGKKFTRLHLKGKSWIWWYAPVILATERGVK